MDKTVAVTAFQDGVLTAVIGERIVISVAQANDMKDALEKRERDLQATRAEQTQAAARAKQLQDELDKNTPVFNQDVEDFAALLKILREKVTEQGGSFPDDRFERYISE